MKRPSRRGEPEPVASDKWCASGIYYWNQTPAGGAEVPADLAKKEVARAKKLGATRLGFFVDLDGLMIYPSRFVPQDPRLAGRDLLGELVTAAHRHGMEVNVFYADDEAEMKRLIEMGVDGILTNYPARLREICH